MDNDSFFSQDNISIAKEVWETSIEELRVEFIKSEEGLEILKQVLEIQELGANLVYFNLNDSYKHLHKLCKT